MKRRNNLVYAFGGDEGKVKVNPNGAQAYSSYGDSTGDIIRNLNNRVNNREKLSPVAVNSPSNDNSTDLTVGSAYARQRSDATAYDKMMNSYDDADKKYQDFIATDTSQYNPSEDDISLSSGKFKTGKLSRSLVNDISEAATKNGIDPYTLLGLAGQESSFKKTNPKNLVSGWNLGEEYKPYDVGRFLADKKVPGVKAIKNNNGISYDIEDQDKINTYLKEHPELIDQYNVRLSTNKYPSKFSYFDAAAKRIKKDGVAKYNAGDKNYEKDVTTSSELLRKDKELSKYMKELETKKKNNSGVAKLAMGGNIEPLVGDASTIIQGLMSVLDNPYKGQSKEPLVNINSMRNVVNPYAMGGSISSIDDLDEEQLAHLEQIANEQGISIEEAFQNEFDNMVAGDESGLDDMQAEGTYAMGGKVPIEVEGKELVETPSGSLSKIKGKSHEQGGVQIEVPHGSKIFSNRLHVEGKSMGERKLAREKRLAKMTKLLDADPTDPLTQNTVNRTKQIIDKEDEQDMMLQNVANHIYSNAGEHAYGGIPDNYSDLLFKNGKFPNLFPLSIDQNAERVNITGMDDPANVVGMDFAATHDKPSYQVNTGSSDSSVENNIGDLTTGDIAGMAGTLFNGIAPLINSRNAAAATKPVINRMKGFGQRAIDANGTAQDIAASTRADANTDIETSGNAARMRNRNGASNVNTLRALDIVTNLGVDNAKNKARGAYDNEMIGLLGQEGQLTNLQDYQERTGQTMADDANQRNIDNIYSNRGADLINLGTSVETVGKNLNTQKSNQVDAKLLSQLSQYGLEIDENGNLISTKQHG